MSYNFLSELSLDKPIKKIKVRITRLSQGVKPTNPSRLLNIEGVAIDAEHNARHFYIKASKASMFQTILKEGSLDAISRLQLKEPKSSYNVMHGDFNICLTSATKIEELHEDVTSFP
ncbi:hypothetical protein PTKIN_Ptkin17bG0056600 [Pterospermum kingtungense]